MSISDLLDIGSSAADPGKTANMAVGKKQQWLAEWERSALEGRNQSSRPVGVVPEDAVVDEPLKETTRQSQSEQLLPIDSALLNSTHLLRRLRGDTGDISGAVKTAAALNPFVDPGKPAAAGQSAPPQTTRRPPSLLSRTQPHAALENTDISHAKPYGPFNMQLIAGEEGITLWVRDFSRKHLGKLREAITLIQKQLNSQGSKLDRLMLNGVDETYRLNDLGEDQWQLNQ